MTARRWRTELTALELDDIQAGALLRAPSPYVGTYLLLRIHDRADGRELVRRLHRLVNAAPDLADPAGDLGHRRLHLPGPEGARACRRRRWTASPRSSGRGWRPARRSWATSVRAAPSTGRSRWARREVHVAMAALVTGCRELEAVVAERARRAHEEMPGVELIWRQDCYQLPTGRTSFGFKDGIGQPAVEGSGTPPDEPGRAAHQGRRDHPGLPRRDGRAGADADPGRPRPQRHLRRVPQAAHPGRGLPPVPARHGASTRRGGACWGRRWSGAGRAARRLPLTPTRTTPSSAATRSATTTSATATTRGASSARSVPTPAGPTRGTPSTTKAASTSGSTG